MPSPCCSPVHPVFFRIDISIDSFFLCAVIGRIVFIHPGMHKILKLFSGFPNRLNSNRLRIQTEDFLSVYRLVGSDTEAVAVFSRRQTPVCFGSKCNVFDTGKFLLVIPFIRIVIIPFFIITFYAVIGAPLSGGSRLYLKLIAGGSAYLVPIKIKVINTANCKFYACILNLVRLRVAADLRGILGVDFLAILYLICAEFIVVGLAAGQLCVDVFCFFRTDCRNSRILSAFLCCPVNLVAGCAVYLVPRQLDFAVGLAFCGKLWKHGLNVLALNHDRHVRICADRNGFSCFRKCRDCCCDCQSHRKRACE